MAMEPTDNDVLSGRGAWFNQHPGNEQFRRMLDEKKAAYMTGTKKQKMDISKAIVEAIYSLDPPGRFLKQCPDNTGQWNELSKRDAADKAAQAMAYAIKGEALKQKRRHRRYSRSSQLSPPQRHLYSHGSNNHQLEGNDVSSSSVALHGLAAHGPAPPADTNNTESTLSNDHTDSVADAMLRVPVVPDTSNRRPQLQQSNSTTTTTLPTTSSIDQSVNQNGLVQVLAQAVQQQRHHHQQQQQQQLPLQYTLGQNNPLGQQMIMPPPQQQQLSPALLEGLTQILTQAQQQQHQQQQQQQLILLQRLMNRQTVNVLPSAASLPPPSNTPYLSLQGVVPMNGILPAAGGASSSTNNQPTANNHQILQNLQQQQLNPPSNNNALLLSSVLSSNFQHPPISNAVTLSNAALTQEAAQQQLDLLQRSLMMQQQQTTLPLDPLHQAWLRQIQNSLNNPQPINAQPSATIAAAMLTRQEEPSEEEERSVSEEKNPT